VLRPKTPCEGQLGVRFLGRAVRCALGTVQLQDGIFHFLDQPRFNPAMFWAKHDVWYTKSGFLSSVTQATKAELAKALRSTMVFGANGATGSVVHEREPSED